VYDDVIAVHKFRPPTEQRQLFEPLCFLEDCLVVTSSLLVLLLLAYWSFDHIFGAADRPISSWELQSAHS
jgi:hypothetical protein